MIVEGKPVENQVPEVASLYQISLESGSSQAFSVTFSDSDADDNHTITVSSDSPKVQISGTGSTSGSEYIVTAAETFEGNAMVTVKVSDGNSSDVETFQVVVSAPVAVTSDPFGKPKVYANNSLTYMGL